jgi:two-component system, OmpR family, response regulator
MEKKRILLIDDDVPLTTLLRINLEGTGTFEVNVVNQSSRALEEAKSFRPDVILLDIVMPGLDGGDILNQISAEFCLRDVPILIMTALLSTDETNGRGWLRSDGRIMVAKPVDFSRLNQIIEGTLAGRIVSGIA